MTTGNVFRDFRVKTPMSAPWSGYSYPGWYFQKSWSGADWPSIPRVERPVLKYVPRTKARRTFEERQIMVNNRAVIEAYKADIKAVIAKKVKRAKEWKSEQHAYSMSFVYSVDDMCHFINDTPGVPAYAREMDATYSYAMGGAVFESRWDNGHDLTLVNRLRSRIIGSEFNLGVFLGESNQALKMIFHAATRLAAAMRAARKGDWKRVERLLRPKGSAPKEVNSFLTPGRTLAMNWLEMMYGWLPLLSDLQEGARMVAHMTEEPFRLKVRARLKVAGKVTAASPSNWEAKDSFQLSKGQIVAYLTEVDVPKLIGLTDIASVAWEKAPWSFVADWAIPIGKFLSARAVASSLSGKFVTTRVDHGTCLGFAPKSTGYYGRSTLGQYQMRSVTLTRTVSTTISVPLPEVKPLGEWLTWRRAANAVALLTVLGTNKSFQGDPWEPIPRRTGRA